jgi:hypothetical protein
MSSRCGAGPPCRPPGDLDADTTGKNGGFSTKISASATTTIRTTADLDPNTTGAGGVHVKIREKRDEGAGDFCPVTSPQVGSDGHRDPGPQGPAADGSVAARTSTPKALQQAVAGAHGHRPQRCRATRTTQTCTQNT